MAVADHTIDVADLAIYQAEGDLRAELARLTNRHRIIEAWYREGQASTQELELARNAMLDAERQVADIEPAKQRLVRGLLTSAERREYRSLVDDLGDLAGQRDELVETVAVVRLRVASLRRRVEQGPDEQQLDNLSRLLDAEADCDEYVEALADVDRRILSIGARVQELQAAALSRVA